MAADEGRRGRRTGRPPGESGNREAILASARREFFERGYDGATIRGIAAGAGVDPALIHHYFGNKDGLLLEVLRQGGPAEISGEEAVARLLAEGLDGLGERVIRRMVDIYEVSVTRAGWGLLSGLVRLASDSEQAAAALRDVFAHGGFARLVRALGAPQPELRVALLGSLLVGLAVARFVIRMEPIASADVDALVAWYGPEVQRLLLGPLPQPPAPASSASTSRSSSSAERTV